MGRGVAVTVAVAIGLAGIAGPHSSAAERWESPVEVTPDFAGGYEPSMVADGFGNLFATAHKENAELVASPDADSPTLSRSMSWKWMSSDAGRSWQEIPGLPADLENHQFGDEGDMALDDAGHLYFVDTTVVDDTLTRWTVKGLGKVAFDFTRPVVPTVEPVDDRPWITAHGDGKVFYVGNEGDKLTYPLGTAPRGSGPGRYTVFRSTDGGQSFDPLGFTLEGSGWCRPAAEHAPGSKWVYVACTDDAGADDVVTAPGDGEHEIGNLYLYASPDDGVTFARHKIGTYIAHDGTSSYPSVAVAPDGAIWVLYVDVVKPGPGIMPDGTCDPTQQLGDCIPVENALHLYRSGDHGRTWQGMDITPRTGRYQYPWLSIARDGTLGMGVYHKRDAKDPWNVYAATWRGWTRPVLEAVAPGRPVETADSDEAPGDYMGSAFLPDGRLSVIWTQVGELPKDAPAAIGWRRVFTTTRR